MAISTGTLPSGPGWWDTINAQSINQSMRSALDSVKYLNNSNQLHGQAMPSIGMGHMTSGNTRTLGVFEIDKAENGFILRFAHRNGETGKVWIFSNYEEMIAQITTNLVAEALR